MGHGGRTILQFGAARYTGNTWSPLQCCLTEGGLERALQNCVATVTLFAFKSSPAHGGHWTGRDSVLNMQMASLVFCVCVFVIFPVDFCMQ